MNSIQICKYFFYIFVNIPRPKHRIVNFFKNGLEVKSNPLIRLIWITYLHASQTVGYKNCKSKGSEGEGASWVTQFLFLFLNNYV